jgi:hypothetical protein
MPLHIVKLCVGCDSVEELSAWQARRLQDLLQRGAAGELIHTTRQTPRRSGFAAGSSIYWVISGFIRARQQITGLRDVRGSDGINRCVLVLDEPLVPTEPFPRRPFQGWRYLPADEAPRDIDRAAPSPDDAMPQAMRAELLELQLIGR